MILKASVVWATSGHVNKRRRTVEVILKSVLAWQARRLARGVDIRVLVPCSPPRG